MIRLEGELQALTCGDKESCGSATRQELLALAAPASQRGAAVPSFQVGMLLLFQPHPIL